MRRILILLLFVTPVLGQERAQESTPSLAELARKERERRARMAEMQAAEGKVIRIIATRPTTPADQPLSDFRGLISTSTLPAAPAAEGGEGAAEGEAAPEGDQSDPAFWAPQFSAAVQAYTMAVQKVQVLQLTINDLRNSYFSASDGALQARLQEQLNAALADLRNTGSEIAAARAEIDQLRGQAAAAGVPAGAINGMVGNLPQPPALPGQ